MVGYLFNDPLEDTEMSVRQSSQSRRLALLVQRSVRGY